MQNEAPPEARRSLAARWFAAGNLMVALAIGLGVFRGWRPRALAVEIAAGVVIALLVASAAGLAVGAAWAARATRVAAVALVVAGVVATSTLTLGMTFFRAVGGPGGGPGWTFLLLALLFVLPYTLLYPVGLLVWLRARGGAG
jgi:hypothetical protein